MMPMKAWIEGNNQGNPALRLWIELSHNVSVCADVYMLKAAV